MWVYFHGDSDFDIKILTWTRILVKPQPSQFGPLKVHRMINRANNYDRNHPAQSISRQPNGNTG